MLARKLTAASARAVAPWYLAGGAPVPVAAYQPIGASSLAASYVNLVSPGTFDAAPGVAPTWASGTGWGFNGTTQFLNAGLALSNIGVAVFIRFSGFALSDGKTIIGAFNSFAGNSISHVIQLNSGNVRSRNGTADPIGLADNAPGLTSGVYGFSGLTPYRNGFAESALITSTAPTGTPLNIYIGALNLNGSAAQFTAANIQAIAIYPSTLTASQVAAVSAAMAAL